MKHLPDWYPYKDIINRPHPVSTHHRAMSMEERAAQFSPFAALTGYEAAIHETARLTDERIELDDDEKELLNEQLQLLAAHIQERPDVKVIFFEPDQTKSGGARKCMTGKLTKIDRYQQKLIFEDKSILPIEQLLHIEERTDG